MLVSSAHRGRARQDAEEWRQFGYDDANTGNAPNNTGPVADIDQQWEFQTGDRVWSPPVVADGTVYVGSDDGNVYALDATDGAQQWQFQTDPSVRSPPAIADGTVYVGSHDDNVYALDTADGTEQWQFQTGADVRSSPAVADGTVYVGSKDYKVYALDTTEGTEQWRYETGGKVESSPAIADGTVYVGSNDDNVYALDAADGTEQWQFQTGADVRSSPAVADGTVYVGSWDSSVYALDAADGTEQWQFQTGADVDSSPAVADGTVYVGSRDSNVYALDATNGTEQWRYETGGMVYSSPAVVDGTVYVGSWDNNVYALDATDGTEQWQFQTGSWVASSPAIADGTVYVGSSDDNVYALAGRTSTSTPTETATTAALQAEQRNGNDGLGLLPIAAGLGLLALGGSGALWWAIGDSDGTDTTTTDSDTPDSGVVTNGAAESVGSTGSSPPNADRADSSAAGTKMASRDKSDLSPTPSNRCIPESIPRAPDLDVNFDALANEEPLGGGGNADVTKARLPTLDGDVTLAIKKPRMSGTLHSEQVERLLNEAETWDKLDDHDHVVGVVDYGSEPLPWIAMEYMDAGHLGERAGEMDVDQALWTAIAITKGVRHAHRRGIAHLDLNPHNILFRSIEGAWDAPKVADWGLSKHLLDHSKSIDGMTVEYAAPEQFDDSLGASDDITDVYQLGAVFYELFTGRPPFEGQPFEVIKQVEVEQPTPPSEVADVPQALDEILLTALAKEKANRHDNVAYLRDVLQDIFDGA